MRRIPGDQKERVIVLGNWPFIGLQGPTQFYPGIETLQSVHVRQGPVRDLIIGDTDHAPSLANRGVGNSDQNIWPSRWLKIH